MTLTSKERSKRYRDGKRDETRDGEAIVTDKVKTIVTLLKRPNGADYDPEELMTNGEKRYMGPFSDGQVLDNTTVGLDLTPRNHVAMKAWAEANIFVPNKYAQRA